MISSATQVLIDHVEELTRLDQAIGDGDHGLNMKRGAQAIQAKLPELAHQALNDALDAMDADGTREAILKKYGVWDESLTKAAMMQQ